MNEPGKMTSRNFPKFTLSAKQKKFLNALFEGESIVSITDACEKIKMSRRNFYYWLESDGFRQCLKREREKRALTYGIFVDRALLKKCLAGDGNCLRLWYERFDDLKQKFGAPLIFEKEEGQGLLIQYPDGTVLTPAQQRALDIEGAKQESLDKIGSINTPEKNLDREANLDQVETNPGTGRTKCDDTKKEKYSTFWPDDDFDDDIGTLR